MRELYDNYSYLADPHGAVGYLGLKKYMKKESCTGIFLETAHPAKFIDEVKKTTGIKADIPDRLGKLRMLEKRSVKLSPDFSMLKEFLSQKPGRRGDI
jgi:threonine synthase